MIIISQKDWRWRESKIGKSNLTLGKYGCLIVSLCMILSKFYPHRGFKHYYSPLEAIRDWSFTKNGLLEWRSINNSGMIFKYRGKYNPNIIMKDPITGKMRKQKDVLKEYMRHKNYGIVLQVLTYRNNQHWLAGQSKSILGWMANDPYLKRVLWAVPFPYKRITGFAIIAKDLTFDN